MKCCSLCKAVAFLSLAELAVQIIHAGLPDHLAWNTKLFQHHDNVTRMWNIHDLEPAFENRGGEGLTSRLLEKLARGERIVVLGIGSSFIATSGGCFQAGLIC